MGFRHGPHIVIPGDTTPIPSELFRGTGKADEFDKEVDDYYFDVILGLREERERLELGDGLPKRINKAAQTIVILVVNNGELSDGIGSSE